MSAAEDRREARRRAARRRVEPDATPAGETALRSKPIRITVDLAPELYRRLSGLTAQAAEAIDAPKVSHADFVRATIRAVTEDPATYARVITELRRLKET